MNETVMAAVLIGLLLFLSKLGEEVALRLRLPGFLGSVLAGLLISGAILGLVTPEDLAPALLLLVIGINFTLFLAGVEELANPALLVPSRREMAVSALILALSSTLVAAVTMLLRIVNGVREALALGIVIALVSAGPLAKIVLGREDIGEEELSIMRIGLLVEVEGLVVFNALVAESNIAEQLILSATFVIFIFVVGRHYLTQLFHIIERYFAVREAPFAMIVSLVLMTGYIAESIGFNAAVTALLLGMFLSEYLEERPLYLERISAFTYGFLEPLFFIGIGIYATRITAKELAIAILLLAVSLAPKLAIAKIQGLRLSQGLIYLAKGGVDAALLLSMLQDGLIGFQVYTTALTTIILSIIIASIYASSPHPHRPEVYRQRIVDLELDRDIVHIDMPADEAAKIVAEKGALVVVDDHLRPVGYITARDFVEVDPDLLENIPLRFFMRKEVPIVSKDKTLQEVLFDVSLLSEPIMAVVDEEGRVIGTLRPRKLLDVLLRKRQRQQTITGEELGSGAPAPQHPRQ
ncbi:cation:proton antiporter domain-containing protein [Pyrofollis japonicus]|uniref:cation:proton antiporter domain-containing protein n=1 Tax=Pyrofollis japonicus TaxID=3060460 RepID=UPI00295BC427|nr:cation:proton antiporter [Pyrofollis japonicus]